MRASYEFLAFFLKMLRPVDAGDILIIVVGSFGA